MKYGCETCYVKENELTRLRNENRILRAELAKYTDDPKRRWLDSLGAVPVEDTIDEKEWVEEIKQKQQAYEVKRPDGDILK
jgi:hypothetical protein